MSRVTEAILRDLAARLPLGISRALPADVLAADLGVSRRTVGALIAELIDRGSLIGSTCHPDGPGYFIPASREELEEGTRHIVSRARASFTRVAKLRRAAERVFGPEVLTLFDIDQEEGVPA